jgi:hypothetical protein
MYQWNSSQIDLAIRSDFSMPTADPMGAAATGDAASMVQTIKNVAGQYLQNASDAMITWWTTDAVKSGQTNAQLQSELQTFFGQQAAQRFPWMATAISRGMTPQDYLSPYTQQAAKTLAIPPDSIDWSDPKWTGALLQTGKDGTQVPVNSDQFNKNLMQNPAFGYSKTQGAIDQAEAVSSQILQTFGAVKR